MIHARVYIRDMSNVNTVITLEQLGQDFTSLFKHRAFRLETLDHYDAPNESGPYARFLAGEPVDPAWREPWKKLVREVRTSGRIMERVKVVSEPVSDYVRFSLLHAAPASVEAGEDVRVLGRSNARHLGDWLDFWLFDDDLTATMYYDYRSGRVRRVELDRRPKLIARLAEDRDKLLLRATPLAQYVADHHITERKRAA